VLVRVYLGGAVQSELLNRSDDQLFEIAKSELAQLLGIDGQPLLKEMTRQIDAMPQYHVGHRQRVATIENRLVHFPTLTFAGSALHGVGVPGCIDSGERAAQSMVDAMKPDFNTSSQVFS
jgi:oxygen-dependent protoporphyrinogen oxidase